MSDLTALEVCVYDQYIATGIHCFNDLVSDHVGMLGDGYTSAEAGLFLGRSIEGWNPVFLAWMVTALVVAIGDGRVGDAA